MYIEEYSLSEVLWEDKGAHSKTKKNAYIKKVSTLKSLYKFLLAINDANNLKGMFKEDIIKTNNNNNNMN